MTHLEMLVGQMWANAVQGGIVLAVLAVLLFVAWAVGENRKLQPQTCTRDEGHETPCNGWPRTGCPQ